MNRLHVMALLALLVLLSSGTGADVVFKKKPNGRVKRITYQFYKSEGLQVQDSSASGQWNLDYTYYYLFDENGHVIEERSYFGKVKCMYTASGFRTAEYTYAREDSSWYKSVGYGTDKHGRIASDTMFNPSGSIAIISIYRYDTHGNLSEWKFKNHEGPNSGQTFEYDSSGNLTAIKSILLSGKAGSKDLMKYNDQGLKTELKQFDNDNSLTSTYSYRYDAQDNLIEYHIYNSTGEATEGYTATYKTDAAGNWTEQIRTGIYGVYKTSRVIEYY